MYTRTRVHLYIYIYVRTYFKIDIYLYIYIYECIYVTTCRYLYMYTLYIMYICVLDIYIYIYMWHRPIRLNIGGAPQDSQAQRCLWPGPRRFGPGPQPWAQARRPRHPARTWLSTAGRGPRPRHRETIGSPIEGGGTSTHSKIQFTLPTSY